MSNDVVLRRGCCRGLIRGLALCGAYVGVYLGDGGVEVGEDCSVD